MRGLMSGRIPTCSAGHPAPGVERLFRRSKAYKPSTATAAASGGQDRAEQRSGWSEEDYGEGWRRWRQEKKREGGGEGWLRRRQQRRQSAVAEAAEYRKEEKEERRGRTAKSAVVHRKRKKAGGGEKRRGAAAFGKRRRRGKGRRRTAATTATEVEKTQKKAEKGAVVWSSAKREEEADGGGATVKSQGRRRGLVVEREERKAVAVLVVRKQRETVRRKKDERRQPWSSANKDPLGSWVKRWGKEGPWRRGLVGWWRRNRGERERRGSDVEGEDDGVDGEGREKREIAGVVAASRILAMARGDSVGSSRGWRRWRRKKKGKKRRKKRGFWRVIFFFFRKVSGRRTLFAKQGITIEVHKQDLSLVLKILGNLLQIYH